MSNTYFPIRIELETGEILVVKTTHELPRGVYFKVLATEVKD